MLNSFLVENFRLFRHLEIARLGQVNLVVGKNNSGKSALLEAVEVYASNASISTLARMVSGREETWNERSQAETSQPSDNAIRHLFLGHQLPKINQKGILFGVYKEAKQIEIITAAYKTEENDAGIIQRKIVLPTLFEEDGIELWLTVQEGDKNRRLMQLDKGSSFSRTRFSALSESEVKYLVQTVPTRNMTAQKIAALWDIIGLTDAKKEVIDGLKLIMPSVVDIAFVGSKSALRKSVSRETRLALVRTSNSLEPLPLKSMGDGMTRLFNIIVALVSAKNGILMIDEFENGLHWSVQSSVWKIIFRLAVDLNVQIFATTHSRDCISSFEEAWKEHPDDGAFLRLQMSCDGSSTARTYTLETLMDSLDTEVEVR